VRAWPGSIELGRRSPSWGEMQKSRLLDERAHLEQKYCPSETDARAWERVSSSAQSVGLQPDIRKAPGSTLDEGHDGFCFHRNATVSSPLMVRSHRLLKTNGGQDLSRKWESRAAARSASCMRSKFDLLPYPCSGINIERQPALGGAPRFSPCGNEATPRRPFIALLFVHCVLHFGVVARCV